MSNHLNFKKVDTAYEKEQIKALWQETFGDSPDYVEDFYKIFATEENALVALDGDRVVGMVNSLDCKARLCGEILRGKYIYALAVKKEYRGRGVAKKLLKMGEGELFTMLIPERDELFEMYAHLGYTVKTDAYKGFIEPHKHFDKMSKTRALVKSENEKLSNAEFFI